MAFFYKYYCEANDRVVEVRHSRELRLNTWGEVCAHAGLEAGTTPTDAPAVRLISGMPWTPRLTGLDKDAPSTKLEL